VGRNIHQASICTFKGDPQTDGYSHEVRSCARTKLATKVIAMVVDRLASDPQDRRDLSRRAT
jgi:hypothetical protein